MALSKEFKKKVEERFGRELKYSQDCEALAQSILEVTKERLGVTTIKRLFGFAGETVAPRASTMDIIAQYLGYDDMADMTSCLGESPDISMFTPVDEIDVISLDHGTQLQITYNPGRLIIMTYLGECRFIVNESQGGKLRKGDILRITQLAKGFEMLVTDVIRDDMSLGAYHAAKDGGLTSIEVIV